MPTLKQGDSVRIAAREVTGDDTKTSLYYGYFGGLLGKVDRVYEDNSVCVDIDLNSLPQPIRTRHQGIQESERKRWLDSLSDESRGRLTPEQKQFRMSYKILVGKSDVQRA